MDYCNIIWGNASQANLNRLFRLQKRACKIILDYNVDDIDQSMQQLKIMTIYERVYFRKSKLMFKVANSLTPSYIKEMFTIQQVNENIPTLRSQVNGIENFIIPRPYKEIFKQSLSYSGPVIWNNLPTVLRNVQTLNTFHSNCI